MLYDLLRYDISEFDVRTVPDTAALHNLLTADLPCY
jgi:hypothetical protein